VRTQLTQHVGKPIDPDKPVDHSQLNNHQKALFIEGEDAKGANKLRDSRLKVLDGFRATVAVLIRLVYWLAVENVAMLKLQSLFALCVGLPGANLGDLPNNYANSTRCREFVMALSNTLKGKLWEGILSSPYVAVAIDESTDISTSENLIIYITYIHNGRTHVSYVGLVHAPAVDAESIHHQLLEYLEDNGLDMSRVMCFCSDGASVMTGSQNGVGVRLQRSSNPFMLCIHCIAHRLALCCADTATDMDYPENEESTLNEVSAYFNRSGKRTSKLQALAKELRRYGPLQPGKDPSVRLLLAIRYLGRLFVH
jgi:hypothetical protein